MDQPMFLFAGVYTTIASAEGDYEVIKLLHSCDEIGSYDAAVIAKRSDGTMTVHRTETPTVRGTWIGLAAAAATAVVCPSLLPSLAESDAAGRGLEAWLGHLARGISGADAKAMGALIEEDLAALVVVGIEPDAGRIEQTAVEATGAMLKHLDADFHAADAEAAQSRSPTAPFTDR
jgi:hypothetical protein